MSPLLLAAVAAQSLILAAGPALAQNAAQIARVQAGASCPKCNLFQADFGGLELKAPDFAGARLRQADLSLSVMAGARLAGADLRDVDGYGAVLTGADLSGADLTNASLVGSYLRGADLSGAILKGANLAGADLTGAKGLAQGRLDQACGDETTRLPPGLSVPPCA